MSLKFGILTISDRSAAGLREDISGPQLAQEVAHLGWTVEQQKIIPDDFKQISETLISWSEEYKLEVVLTTGGTGFSPRDVTPEATLAVIERETPGISEAMRSASLLITPHAMLSRARAGIRRKTLIINLPGSPKAALENLAVITKVLPHAVQLLRDEPEAEKGHHLGEPENL